MVINETDKIKIQNITSACADFCKNRGCADCPLKKYRQGKYMGDCDIYGLAALKTLALEKEETSESIESVTCKKILILLNDLDYYQGVAVLEIAKEIILRETRKEGF